MIPIPQTKADLEKMISDKVEESIHLDYKDARSFSPDGKKNPKTEIAKDVSSMANSAGGVIIYGMKEFVEPDKQHLPETITPINRTEFSKEWLEQVIHSNISPKIEGLLVYPIALDEPNEVVYVVEIPQSTTAHQNTADGRYYRRYNFLAQIMLDYEIRDIMNRAKHPVIELGFVIEKETFEMRDDLFRLPVSVQPQKEKEFKTTYTLEIYPTNTGNIFAQYINYFVHLPEDIADPKEAQYLKRHQEGVLEFYGENTYRDVVDAEVNIGGVIRKYGPSRFDPVLPGLRGRSEKLLLAKEPKLDEREVMWTVHADNALPKSGKIRLNEIPAKVKNEKN
jgi:hypothetical protein